MLENRTVNSDIYSIADYISSFKEKHVLNVDEDVLMMSTFGYIGDLFMTNMQNNIIMASEWGLEAFPVTARFDKNVLTHAIMYDVQDINATPAKMDILLGFCESELVRAMGETNQFILDNETKIMVDEFEFHLDYSIKIEKTLSPTLDAAGERETIYLAQYIMTERNELSDINKPYLLPPAKMVLGGDGFILLQTHIRQVSFQVHHHRIVSDSVIENKSFEFEFDDQLSYFDVQVKNTFGDSVILYPLLDGSPIPHDERMHCYYEYINSNKIRIKFISESFEPRINLDVIVRISATKGSKGVFTYKEDILITPTSSVYDYENMTILIKPASPSEYGIDRKTVEDLRRIIPKEALSRGSITSAQDLDNYFSMLDNNRNRLVFKEKIDNPLDRVYYSYILIKDADDNIIPTNTIGIEFTQDQLITHDNRIAIAPGTLIELPKGSDYARISDSPALGSVKYSTPFLISINNNPLTVSYYLTIIDIKYMPSFNFINQSSIVQFIMDRVNIVRKFLDEPMHYKIRTTIGQNIKTDMGLIVKDEETSVVTETNVRLIYLFHDRKNNPIAYKEAVLVNNSEEYYEYDFEADITTNNDIHNDEIMLMDIVPTESTISTRMYIPRSTKVTVITLCKFKDELGRNNIDKIIPGLEGWSVTNTYDIDGMELFINYTDIMSSAIKVLPPESKQITSLPSIDDVDGELHIEEEPQEVLVNRYRMESVPFVGYDYIYNEERMNYFIQYLVSRKLYIDNALTLLESSFSIDFKFFNTFGPSKLFRVGYEKELLDRVNITLKFRLRLDITSEDDMKNIIVNEIKEYLENINDVDADGNFYISQLIQHLTNKYVNIVALDFVGINDYGPGYQYIEFDKTANDPKWVPEFINIHSQTAEYVPDIRIELV